MTLGYARFAHNRTVNGTIFSAVRQSKSLNRNKICPIGGISFNRSFN